MIRKDEDNDEMGRKLSEDEAYEIQMIQEEDGDDINYLKTEYRELKELVD